MGGSHAVAGALGDEAALELSKRSKTGSARSPAADDVPMFFAGKQRHSLLLGVIVESPERVLWTMRLEPIPTKLNRICHSRESGNPGGAHVVRPLGPRVRGDDAVIAIQPDREAPYPRDPASIENLLGSSRHGSNTMAPLWEKSLILRETR